jgi:hypothetical protein
MTTRYLNKTWRDVVFDRYAADFDADVPFPVRYLIHTPEWKKDIFIEVPTKIPVATFRRSILTFVRAKRLDSDPAYRGEKSLLESVYLSSKDKLKKPITNMTSRDPEPRMVLTSLAMFGTPARAWDCR